MRGEGEERLMSHVDAVGLPATPAKPRALASGGLTFDWVTVALCAWLEGGGFLDGWAHNHGRVDASFFTPWHAVLYTGFLAVAGWLVAVLAHNRVQGEAWGRALPPGYGLSLVGVLVFGAGGLGDVLWHQLFGVEQSLEALYSPSHLTLAAGSALIVSGPFRAAWQRRDRASTPGCGQLLPMLLSLTLTLSGFTFSAQVLHPLLPLRRIMALPGADEMLLYLHTLLIASVLIQILLKLSVVLLAMRRWQLPPGSITLVFTLNGLLMSTLDPYNEYGLIVPVMLTGLVADGVRSRLRPTPERSWAFRLFAFIIPVLFYLCYFEALRLLNGWWWSVHLWTGAIMLAGLVGWLLSYLILPPQEPRAEHAR
jgi:hypothetical protein